MTYDYSYADWDGLHDHLRDVPWEDIIKLGASMAASEFCEYVHVRIDVYKYQVKPHSSLWFSAACAGLSLKKTPHKWLPHTKATFYCYGVRS